MCTCVWGKICAICVCVYESMNGWVQFVCMGGVDACMCMCVYVHMCTCMEGAVAYLCVYICMCLSLSVLRELVGFPTAPTSEKNKEKNKNKNRNEVRGSRARGKGCIYISYK